MNDFNSLEFERLKAANEMMFQQFWFASALFAILGFMTLYTGLNDGHVENFWRMLFNYYARIVNMLRRLLNVRIGLFLLLCHMLVTGADADENKTEIFPKFLGSLFFGGVETTSLSTRTGTWAEWWSDFHQMTWTSAWHTLPFMMVLFTVIGACAVLSVAMHYAILPMVIYIVKKIIHIMRFLDESCCCAIICAGRPFVIIRTLARDFCMKYWVCVQRYHKNHYGLKRVEERTIIKDPYTSPMRSDDKGLFLENGDTRIYMDLTNSTLTDQVMLNPFINRISSIRKETVLIGSKFYKVEKFPPFVGRFIASEITIGYFSRVKIGKLDLIVTAAHVLAYNKMADILLEKDGNKVRLGEFDSEVIAYSPEDKMDFIFIKCPTRVYSLLGLKVGKVATRIAAGSPVSIYQYKNGERAVTTGCVQKEDRPWYIKHGASSDVGTSGAPLLDVRQHIVAIHVEGNNGCNYAVIPPLLRGFSVKESASREDVVGDDDSEERARLAEEAAIRQAEDQERADEAAEKRAEAQADQQQQYEERARDWGMKQTREQAELSRTSARGRNWAEQVEDFEAALSDEVPMPPVSGGSKVSMDDLADEMGIAVFTTGKRHKPVPRPVNFKESPWTCSECGLTQLHHGTTCSSCGKPMIPLAKQLITNDKAIATVTNIVEETYNGVSVPLDDSRPVLPAVAAEKILKELYEIQTRMAAFYQIQEGFNHSFACIRDWYNGQSSRVEIMSEAVKRLEDYTLKIDQSLANVLKLNPSINMIEKNNQGVPGNIQFKDNAVVVDKVLGLDNGGDLTYVDRDPERVVKIPTIIVSKNEKLKEKNKKRRERRKQIKEELSDAKKEEAACLPNEVNSKQYLGESKDKKSVYLRNGNAVKRVPNPQPKPRKETNTDHLNSMSPTMNCGGH